MDIITRGDWDGLVSSVLLSEVQSIREIKFVHPKDVQDGLIEATEEDIVVNVPHIKGCGLWFDHHVSQTDTLSDIGDFNGRFEMAPSCARVIYNHYTPENTEKFAPHMALLEAADKIDSAQLTEEDVNNPSGWVLLGLTIDPRSGLGPEFRDYFRWLVEYVKELPMEKVLANHIVLKKTDRVRTENDTFKKLVIKHAHVDGNVIVVDFQGLKEKPVGNRFLIFTMFPEANIEMRLFDGHKGAVVVAVGHSIFNRTSTVDVGNLLKEYGGGGHKGAGTTQLPAEVAKEKIAEILERIKD